LLGCNEEEQQAAGGAAMKKFQNYSESVAIFPGYAVSTDSNSGEKRNYASKSKDARGARAPVCSRKSESDQNR
jgi:hypothetical protein